MTFSSFFLIVRNALRHRTRNALTVASLAGSLCLVGVLLALSRALFVGSDVEPGQARRLVVHHKIALTQDLPVAFEQTIRKIPGVRAVTRLRWFGGTYRDSRDSKNQFAQFAVEPQTLFAVYPEFQIGESARRLFQSQKTACVASRALADRLAWKPGERIALIGTALPVNLELTLAGVFDAPTQTAVLYFNWDYLRDSLRPGEDARDMAQQFYVQADRDDAVADIARQIDATSDNSPHPTKSEPEQAFMLSFVAFLGNLKLFLAALCGAVLFTMLLISANMLSMSVRERTREIGILKSLGFTDGEVLAMVVGESTLIAGVGGILGCALAAALCAGIQAAAQNAPGFASVIRGVALSPLLAAATFAIAVAIGAIGAVMPAFYAARTSIVDALRHAG